MNSQTRVPLIWVLFGGAAIVASAAVAAGANTLVVLSTGEVQTFDFQKTTDIAQYVLATGLGLVAMLTTMRAFMKARQGEGDSKALIILGLSAPAFMFLGVGIGMVAGLKIHESHKRNVMSIAEFTCGDALGPEASDDQRKRCLNLVDGCRNEFEQTVCHKPTSAEDAQRCYQFASNQLTGLNESQTKLLNAEISDAEDKIVFACIVRQLD